MEHYFPSLNGMLLVAGATVPTIMVIMQLNDVAVACGILVSLMAATEYLMKIAIRIREWRDMPKKK